MTMQPFLADMACPACGAIVRVTGEPPMARDIKVFWLKFPPHGECELSGKDMMVDEWEDDGNGHLMMGGFKVL